MHVTLYYKKLKQILWKKVYRPKTNIGHWQQRAGTWRLQANFTTNYSEKHWERSNNWWRLLATVNIYKHALCHFHTFRKISRQALQKSTYQTISADPATAHHAEHHLYLPPFMLKEKFIPCLTYKYKSSEQQKKGLHDILAGGSINCRLGIETAHEGKWWRILPSIQRAQSLMSQGVHRYNLKWPWTLQGCT